VDPSAHASVSGDAQEADERRPTGVLLADRHAVVREGLRRILGQSDGVVIVGEASDGDEVIDLLIRRRPDVVVIDAGLPGDGYETARRVNSNSPETDVLLLIEVVDGEGYLDARTYGAAGVIGRDATPAVICAAVHRVAAGEIYADPRIDPALRLAEVAPVQRVLTPREQQILQLLADGYTNREVGARLVLGSETVKTHVAHILTKLNAAHRSQAVAIGMRDGLIR
jgi:DNA-binding NarL/FixJ family response regulator